MKNIETQALSYLYEKLAKAEHKVAIIKQAIAMAENRNVEIKLQMPVLDEKQKEDLKQAMEIHPIVGKFDNGKYDYEENEALNEAIDRGEIQPPVETVVIKTPSDDRAGTLFEALDEIHIVKAKKKQTTNTLVEAPPVPTSEAKYFMTDNEFREAMPKLLLESGKSQSEVARTLGFHYSYVNKFIQGKAKSITLLKNLAAYFKVKITEINLPEQTKIKSNKVSGKREPKTPPV